MKFWAFFNGATSLAVSSYFTAIKHFVSWNNSVPARLRDRGIIFYGVVFVFSSDKRPDWRGLTESPNLSPCLLMERQGGRKAVKNMSRNLLLREGLIRWSWGEIYSAHLRHLNRSFREGNENLETLKNVDWTELPLRTLVSLLWGLNKRKLYWWLPWFVLLSLWHKRNVFVVLYCFSQVYLHPSLHLLPPDKSWSSAQSLSLRNVKTKQDQQVTCGDTWRPRQEFSQRNICDLFI